MIKTQILVKSFRRFRSLERFVLSVKQFYPDLDILVADDSFELKPIVPLVVVDRIKAMPGVSWIQMPFDSGLSAGRNRLVQESTADMVVLCDDDFVFTEETCLEKLLTLTTQFDVVAGLVRDGSRVFGSPGRFRFNEGHPKLLEVLPSNQPWQQMKGIRYQQADMVLNFFAAHRTILEKFPWDERFKITGEHLDFFLSLYSGGARVAHTPDVTVDHVRDLPPGYQHYRCRQSSFRPLLAKKWGLAKLPVYRPYIENLT